MRKIVISVLLFLGLVASSKAQTKHVIGENFGGGIVFVEPKKMYWSSTENDGCNALAQCLNMQPWLGTNKRISAIAHADRDF